MSKRTSWLLAFILALVVLSACESGSVSGSRERCSQRMDSGQCEGSFKKLSGTYTVNVENNLVSSGTPVQVHVQVSVESGPLKVWIKAPGDEITSVEIVPGEPAILTGVAVGDPDEFDVKFQALDGEALGVTYEIRYQLD